MEKSPSAYFLPLMVVWVQPNMASERNRRGFWQKTHNVWILHDLYTHLVDTPASIHLGILTQSRIPRGVYSGGF